MMHNSQNNGSFETIVVIRILDYKSEAENSTGLGKRVREIFLEMINFSFIVGLVILDETLYAVSNLSKLLQEEKITLFIFFLLLSLEL